MMIIGLVVTKMVNSPAHDSQHRLAGEAGNAYIEYFVLAAAVLVATIGFYTAHLKDETSGVRAKVGQTFDQLVQKVLAP